jgi:hypothetical protein
MPLIGQLALALALIVALFDYRQPAGCAARYFRRC